MWNSSIALPRRKYEDQDKDGFPQEKSYEWEHGIPASFVDVTRNDEVLAAQKGYSADQNIEIMECNYQGESFLFDESEEAVYDIRRTFRKDKSMVLVLTCERREHGKI